MTAAWPEPLILFGAVVKYTREGKGMTITIGLAPEVETRLAERARVL